MFRRPLNVQQQALLVRVFARTMALLLKANNLNMQPLQEPTAWQLYRRLAVYLKGYWKVFTVAIVAMLVVAATMPLFGYLFKPLINEGFVDKNMQKMSSAATGHCGAVYRARRV